MIHCKDLSFKYADRLIYSNVNIDVSEQEIYFVFGKNGAGKTTLLKQVADLSGNALFIPNSPYTDGDLTTSDIIDLVPTVNIVSVLSHLSALNLGDEILNRSFADLSLGEKQILWLLVAISTQHEIVILDEPTSNLDIRFTQHISNLILATSKKLKKVFLISSHNFQFAMNFPNSRGGILSQKNLFSFKSIDEVFESVEFKKEFEVQPKIIVDTGKRHLIFE